MTQARPETRQSAGRRVGLLGIAGNLVLALGKLRIGSGGSAAVMADGLNNLGDCASSAVTALGFTLAGREKDARHPYGHGRMEYVCGFVIALLLLAAALSAARDAVGCLLAPRRVCLSPGQAALLAGSVAGKGAMAWHAGVQARKLDSPALRAAQRDDVADALVTAGTLAAIGAQPLVALPLDGVAGLAVAGVILWSGWRTLRENLARLLGVGADAATERAVRESVLGDPLFRSVEAVALHDYGPAERVAFIKVTFVRSPALPGTAEALAAAQARLAALGIDATFYWDAAEETDPRRALGKGD